MKKYTSRNCNRRANVSRVILSLILLAALTTCKKQPDAPTGGNKIEIGQTTTDSVSFFEAKVSTELTSTGGNTISQHGHCWSTQSKPTTADNKTTLGKLNSPEIFTSKLTGLLDNTTYYVRSYVTYPYGTVYGLEQTLKTLKIGKPRVTTAEVTDITRTTAQSGGTNDDDGLTVSARGVCWNTTGNPTLENSTGHTTDGIGTGSFTSQLTALDENTTYYVAAYATNEKGTGYGNVNSFKTFQYNQPSVTTLEVTGITKTSALTGGIISGNNIGTITARGVCWNTTGNPTLENNTGFTSDGSGTGTYPSQLTGLIENTTYFVTAYATNEKGTSYGQVEMFITLEEVPCGQLTVDYGGQIYHTVQIGDQCWMEENLNIGTRINGNEEMQDNQVIEKYCYGDNEDNCDLYGGLYQWNEMMQYSTSNGEQGICPDGWHLPTDEEWKTLEMHLGMSQSEADATLWRGTDEGKKLKSTSGWHNGGNGIDEVDFSALPGGYRDPSSNFISLVERGLWWSATEYSSSIAWARGLNYNYDKVDRGTNYKVNGFSVRCVKD
jgi:uncharacterized protein (TIGR02145 family)